MNDLWRLDAGRLIAGYRDGSFTPVQALQSCLARSEEVHSQLNAVIATDRDGALAAARESASRWRAGRAASLLDGVPVAVKDNLHVRGLPTTWGSRLLAGLMPPDDELPVARLRAAGALLFCKTNVPEFTMQGYTDNALFGATGNPWNPALTPGGSSGGSVALVAAGGCPLALCTDGGGSIRRPASHTGLVGFKPSRGRVARAGGLPPIFLGFEVVGPVARTVGDACTMLQVLGGPDPRDPDSVAYRTAGSDGLPDPGAAPAQGLRILHIPRFGDHPVDPQIAALTEAAARGLAAMGHTVSTAQRFDAVEAVNAAWPLLAQSGLAWLVDHPGELGAAYAAPGDARFAAQGFGPAMQASERGGRETAAPVLFGLLFELERLRGALSSLFGEFDVLLTPAAAALPWPKAESHPPRIDGRDVGPRGHAVFTAFANAAGLPAIVLPCGFAQGLPVGLQLVGREGDDDRLFALARQFERAHPWPGRLPMDPAG